MLFVPLASDSLGVRSLACLVKTKDEGFLIDPSAALGPRRYGLFPTMQELNMLELSFERIIDYSKQASKIIITHYHYDHFPNPDSRYDELKKIFSGKEVFAIDYKLMHRSGKQRGKRFEEAAKDICNLNFLQNKEIRFGKTLIKFSPPFWHGEVNSKVGKVMLVYIESGKHSFLFGSDAQNLADPEALEWAIEVNPKIAVIDGYPTIFVGWRFSKEKFLKSNKNVIKFMEETNVKTLLYDHHIVRDKNYREKAGEIFEAAEQLGVKIFTYAEYLGLNNLFLEAFRKEIANGEISFDVYSFDKKIREAIDRILSKEG